MGSSQQSGSLRIARFVAHHLEVPAQPPGGEAVPVSLVVGPGGPLPFAVRRLGARRWVLMVGGDTADDGTFRTYRSACAAARAASRDLVADLQSLAASGLVA
jgi:hypothetical protein